jgi:hypothetical protein
MLPKMPYVMRKNKRQNVPIGNINYSNVLRDGDIADSKGISARGYPYLSTVGAREDIELDGVSAMTVFKGKFVTVRGNELYFGDEYIDNVSVGEKQFAAINNKLCIMPDKMYFDYEDRKLKPLEATVRSLGAEITANSITVKDTFFEAASGYGASFAEDTMTIKQRQTVFENTDTRRFFERRGFIEFAEAIYEGYVWGNKQYDYLQPMENTWLGLDRDDVIYVDGVRYTVSQISTQIGDTNSYAQTGLIYVNEAVNFEDRKWTRIYKVITPDLSMLEDSGVIEHVYGAEREFVSYRKSGDRLEAFLAGNYKDSTALYTAGWSTELTKVVNVGEFITIPGILQEAVEVKEVTANTISVNGAFPEGDKSEELTLMLKTVAALEQKFKVGDVVKTLGCPDDKNNTSFKISRIDGLTLYTESDIFAEATETGFITVERRLPDLDYICEHNNRIFGCSNADNTIYASALGDPTNFFDYTGISTDSWAVAVGSEERFTGCISYGGDVLFFKEMKLHKLMGSYPAEYALYEYDVEGVEEGSHGSLQIINEVLYYKGIHGIFAFTGSPTLISQNFGDKRFSGAVAGSDGETYYVSMSDGMRSYLFAYKTALGMWVLESDEQVTSFARIGGDVYLLCGGKICRYNASDTSADTEWFVQFTPFYETIEGRKSYSRLLIRLELPLDSYVIIKTRFDGGMWHEAGKVVGKKNDVVPVMIPINRCDKFEIMLCGKGKCTVLDMMREFYVRGDR